MNAVPVQTCPFCKSQIDAGAFICPHCQAMKGYRTRNGMRSKAYVIAYAVLLGAVSISICILLLAISPAKFLTWLMLLMAAVTGVSGIAMFRYAYGEPRWYRNV